MEMLNPPSLKADSYGLFARSNSSPNSNSCRTNWKLMFIMTGSCLIMGGGWLDFDLMHERLLFRFPVRTLFFTQ